MRVLAGRRSGAHQQFRRSTRTPTAGLGPLLDSIVAEARHLGAASLTLEVRRSKLAAQRSYRSAGFHEAGLRKKYYTHPVEDALVLLQKNRLDTRDTPLTSVIVRVIGTAAYRTGPGREAETMAEDLKHLLIETNQEFRQLAAKHHSLDDRLHELESNHYLSDAEQFEEVSFKKRKLQVKDRMEFDHCASYRLTSTLRGLSA